MATDNLRSKHNLSEDRVKVRHIRIVHILKTEIETPVTFIEASQIGNNHSNDKAISGVVYFLN